MTLHPALVAVLLATGGAAGALPPSAEADTTPGSTADVPYLASNEDIAALTARYLRSDLYRLADPAPSALGRHWQLPLLRSLPVGDQQVWLPMRATESRGFGAGQMVMSRYSLLGSDDRFNLDWRSGFKPRYADDRALPGDRGDWSLGAVLSKGFGPLAFSVAANRNFIGRSVGVASRDTWSSELYGGYGFVGGSTVGVDFNWSQSSVPGADASRVLSLSSTFVMTRREKLAFTLSHGFGNTDANADVNVVYSHSFQ